MRVPGHRDLQLEGIANAERENGKKRCVAEIVLITGDEGVETLLEVRVAVDRSTTDVLGQRGHARAACEGDLQCRLAYVIETCFERQAEVC